MAQAETFLKLGETIAHELVERVELLEINVPVIVALDFANSCLNELLHDRFSNSLIHSIDHPYRKSTELEATEPGADSIHSMPFILPLESNSVDLVISNLAVTFFPSQEFAAECFRVLGDDGIVLTSAFAPGAFQELSVACAAMNASTFMADFVDMHNFADLLLATGFTNPVVDAEHQQYCYADLNSLLSTFIDGGLADGLLDNPEVLKDREFITRLMSSYPRSPGNPTKFMLSIEYFFGIAWKKTRQSHSAKVQFRAE